MAAHEIDEMDEQEVQNTFVGVGIKKSSLDEAGLIELTRQGSAASYASLYIKYKEFAIRYVRKEISYKDQDEVMDIVEETFVSIYSAIMNGKGPKDQFGPYLVISLKNESRRRKRINEKYENLIDPHSVSVIESNNYQKRINGEMEMNNSIENHIDDLQSKLIFETFSYIKSDDTFVLWRRIVDGFSYKEIANELNVSETRVRRKFEQAKEHFRRGYFHLYESRIQDDSCKKVIPSFHRYYIKKTTPYVTKSIEVHLESCKSCAKVYYGIDDASSVLWASGLFGSVLAGKLMKVGYLSATESGITATGASGVVLQKSSVSVMKILAMKSVHIGISAVVLTSSLMFYIFSREKQPEVSSPSTTVTQTLPVQSTTLLLPTTAISIIQSVVPESTNTTQTQVETTTTTSIVPVIFEHDLGVQAELLPSTFSLTQRTVLRVNVTNIGPDAIVNNSDETSTKLILDFSTPISIGEIRQRTWQCEQRIDKKRITCLYPGDIDVGSIGTETLGIFIEPLDSGTIGDNVQVEATISKLDTFDDAGNVISHELNELNNSYIFEAPVIE